jgi:predicted glycosyltransferase involved in capsule biosynthesis
LKKHIFDKIGGWDENFIGWGGEDDAIAHKLRLFNVKMVKMNYIGYHLYHEDSGGKCESEYSSKHYKDNCTLLDTEYKHTNIDRLKNYISKNKDIGNVNKYKKSQKIA